MSEPEQFNRKQFLTALAALAAGTPAWMAAKTAPSGERKVNAGPVANFSEARLYDQFHDQGFFLIRKGGQILALSAICTHRRCKLEAESDGSFACDCHGSTFDPNGKVTAGPARRDLPRLRTYVDDQNHLIVLVPP